MRIERENQTLATITFQNYFRMYDKLAGMTGTAETEAEEFAEDLQARRHRDPDEPHACSGSTLRTSSTRPSARSSTRSSTTSSSATRRASPCSSAPSRSRSPRPLSSLLKKRGIRHEVLNAKYHEREAEIVAQAGRESAVTIATNMAGRGTDILLGGNPDFLSKEILRKRGLDPVTAAAPEREAALAEARRITEPEHQRVVERGGLHIVGTERHEARRIDNQLRGRSGRQGDPGSSRFYLSLAGRPAAHLRLAARRADHGAPGHGGGRADRAQARDPRDRHGAEARRDPQLRDPQAPARVRRRDEQAARGHLRDAPPDPRGREPGRDHRRVGRRARREHPRRLRRPGRALRGLGPRRPDRGAPPAVRHAGAAGGVQRDRLARGAGRARAGRGQGAPGRARAASSAPSSCRRSSGTRC